MLISLLAGIYLSFLCWTWGKIILKSLEKFSSGRINHLPDFPLTCLAGLAGLTAFAGILSLFYPLGGWEIQPVLLIPGLIFVLSNPRQSFIHEVRLCFTGLSTILKLLLLLLLVLILVMSTWTIVHPDTLGYHAQTIQWIEKYKAIPGLVHLHSRLGYQGLWFVANAFSGFHFTGLGAVTYLNITLLAWFFIFLVNKIQTDSKQAENNPKVFFWIMLLVFSLWSYTQVRLTATSASPDFIAALLLWAVFYLVVQAGNRPSAAHWLLVILISVFSIVVKLSSAPVIIITVWAFLQLVRDKKPKALFLALVISLIVLFPFLARNIITSGYPVFPSPFPDIINTDWKYSTELTLLEKNYISAYARTTGAETPEEIQRILNLRTVEWVPTWWKNRSLADKTITALLLIALVTSFFFLKKIFRLQPGTKAVLVTALAGVIFWFIQAPDPRFGFGFIIPLSGMLFCLIITLPKGNLVEKSNRILLFMISLVIAAYTIYRFTQFFSASQWWKPKGIPETPYRQFQCKGIEFNTPLNDPDCRNIAIPCVYDSCRTFQLRGTDIESGFRAGKESE